MKRALFVASLAGAALALSPSVTWACTTVTTSIGTFTVATVASNGTFVQGEVDASGCDIGVYVGEGVVGIVELANIHDANKYGVFVDGKGDVRSSTVTNTGNHTSGVFDPNGVQTGIGVYYSEEAEGGVVYNGISAYQKGGIVVRNLDRVIIAENTVAGLGPFKFIAQNGIQVQNVTADNVGHVAQNVVSGNIYTEGAATGYVSSGILAFTGSSYTGNAGTLISALRTSNTVFKNQLNIYVGL